VLIGDLKPSPHLGAGRISQKLNNFAYQMVDVYLDFMHFWQDIVIRSPYREEGSGRSMNPPLF